MTSATLRPFQRAGADWLAARRFALLADTMGLGKTAQALTALRSLSAPRALIVAPLATAGGWQREAALWAPERPVTVVRRADPVPDGPCTILVPWTDVAARIGALVRQDWDALVLDEAHRAKAGSESQVGAATWGRLVPAARVCWALTATPMPNGRPVELLPAAQSLLGLVGPGAPYRRASDYRRLHCRRPCHWSRLGYDDMGASRLPRLRDALAASGRYLCRTPEDVPGQLPDLVRQVEWLEGLGAVLEPSVPGMANTLPDLEEMSEYRKLIGIHKVRHAAAWIKDKLQDEESLVAFVHHQDVAHALAKELGHLALVATGADDAEVRQAQVDRFGDGQGRVLIASIAACGTGMNGMHRRTGHAVFVELPWSPAECEQAEGRIRRMGGVAQQALAHYLVADVSLDQHALRLIGRKRGWLDTALDVDGLLTPRQAVALEEMLQ